MHKVKLVMSVWNSYSAEESEAWISVFKEVYLPFVPFIGLEINLPSEKVWKIKSITWDMEKEIFSCLLEDLFCDIEIDSLMFEEWIDYFNEKNWKQFGPFKKEELK